LKIRNKFELKFKLHDSYNTTKQVQDFIQTSTVHSDTVFNTVVATVTPRVSHSTFILCDVSYMVDAAVTLTF
jgi:hypothetical protein